MSETATETEPETTVPTGTDTGQESETKEETKPGKEEKGKPEKGKKTKERKKEKFTLLLKGVSRIYGDGGAEVAALVGVNLNLRKGSVSAIMGPSGSGKSTLINLIGSLDVPSRGEVVVDGVNLEHMSAKELTAYRREKVGFVFQSFNLLPNLTAVENVELPMEFCGVGSEERRERAEKLLKAVKMESRGDHLPGDLSGGEKQRVAIARSLANNPAIILADEPTGNLDTKSGTKVIQLLKSLARNRNKTLLIVTHDQKIAEMTDRIITLEDGKIAEIRDVGDSNPKQALARELDIPGHLVERLFSMGYDELEKILHLNEAELMVKNFKKKDKRSIMDKIAEFKHLVSKNICYDCAREIPIRGVSFCPFCGARL